MRRVFLLLILLGPALLFSQNSKKPIYTISGKIIDSKTKIAIEDATIIFKNIDSKEIKYGGITSQRGKFSIDVEQGTYKATVEFISYKTKTLNISTINRDLNIGTITLEMDVKNLGEVEVVAEKSTLEFKKRKMVFNVGKDIAASGSTITQILSNIPSVDVDPSGNIKLNGQDNVAVMINGKTTSLSKADALKSLPAGSVEKIEVINNPGASYSATIGAIINIVLKRGKDEGLNASLTGTGGFKDYYGTLLTLNHKSKKINFFTNTSYFHRNPIQLATTKNEYFNNGVTTSYLNEYSESEQPTNAFVSTIGTDFYLSKKSTLTTTLNYTNLDSKNHSKTFSNILDASKNSTATNNRSNDGTFNDEILEFVVNFEQKFAKEGQILTAYVTHSNDKEHYINNFTNTNSNFSDDNFRQNNTLKNTETKLVYDNPINETSDYEIGYQGNFGDTPFEYVEVNTSKLIDFKDTNHAFFIIYGKQLNKLYYQIGLRAEFLNYKINYAYLNTTQNKKYNNLFPDFVMDYSFSDTKSLSLSYSKTYYLPGYYELQPFETKVSETTTYKGNEDLNPIYLNNFQMAYNYIGKKISLYSRIHYTIYTDYWQYVTYETGEQVNGLNKLITKPINLGKLNYAAAIFTAIYKPSKIISFTANTTIANFDQSGIFQIVNAANKTITQDFNSNNTNVDFSLLTKISIPNWFSVQTNVKHYLKSKGPVSTRQAYTYANFAISKDIFDKNATISITSDDIFNSSRLKRTRFDTNYISDVYSRNQYPTILASFTYRFNQRKQDRKVNFNKKEDDIKIKF